MKKGIYRFINAIIVLFLFITNIPLVYADESLENIDYTESLETFNNPERVFYKTLGYTFKPTGNKAPSAYSLGGNLIHLRLNLGQFSKAVNNDKDLELTDDMLKTFDTMLKTIKSNGGTAIVRFAYDNFNGVKNLEPSLDMLLHHIEQLSPVFYENKDVISYIELGFFGPWGEMHSSSICNYDNVNLAIDKMLKSAPKEITIGVRHPNYYAKWKGIDRATLNTDITKKGTNDYRLGIFNDGYLGSESDLGTFANREVETAWLFNQARHTFYGGEVVKSFGKKDFNTTEYISKEGFITHTTYLNSEWNQEVINNWKNEIYNGSDTLYKGESGYNYINNHLGYRFVIRKSSIKDTPKNEDLELNLKIENVGFANLINQKTVSILLENDNNLYEIKTNIDATTWNSKETTNIQSKIKLPDDIPLGEYKVYLRLSKYGDLTTDNNYQAIRFANKDIWNQTLGANYIGNVLINKEEIKPDTSQDNNQQNYDNSYDNSEENNYSNNSNQNKDTIKIEKVNVPDTSANTPIYQYVIGIIIFSLGLALMDSAIRKAKYN